MYWQAEARTEEARRFIRDIKRITRRKFTTEKKLEILGLVADSGLLHLRALAQLGMPKSTYYRWLKRQAEGRLEDRISLRPSGEGECLIGSV